MSLGTENSRWPTAISVLELTFDKQTISGEILQYKIRFVLQMSEHRKRFLDSSSDSVVAVVNRQRGEQFKIRPFKSGFRSTTSSLTRLFG